MYRGSISIPNTGQEKLRVLNLSCWLGLELPVTHHMKDHILDAQLLTLIVSEKTHLDNSFFPWSLSGT